MLTRWTCLAVALCDESGTASGMRDTMWLSAWGFSEPSLNWLLPERDVNGGIWDCPGTISRTCISSQNVVGDGVAAVVCIWGFTTAKTLNSVVLYFICPSWKRSAASPQHACISSSSLFCFCWKLSIQSFTVLKIVPITQPGSSSSLSLPSSVSSSSSSSSFPSSSSSELARLLKLSPIAFNISSSVISGFVVVDLAFSTLNICSCSCIIAVSPSWTHFLATVVSLSTWCSIHFSFSSLLEKCVSSRLSTESLFLDRKLRNALNARTLSTSKPLLSLMAWWLRRVAFFVDLPYYSARRGKWSFFGALTIVSCVDLVVGWDVECCKIWTTWRQAESFMPR